VIATVRPRTVDEDIVEYKISVASKVPPQFLSAGCWILILNPLLKIIRAKFQNLDPRLSKQILVIQTPSETSSLPKSSTDQEQLTIMVYIPPPTDMINKSIGQQKE